MEYGGNTPLQAAVISGNMDIIDLLLEFGADVNGPPGAYGGALQYAVSGGKDAEEIIRRLLAEGAILKDAESDRGILCSAYEGGLRELIPKLIALGADVNKPREGWTPLAMALVRKDAEIERLLRSHGANLGNIGSAAIVGAMENDDIKGLEALLAEGIDSNTLIWRHPDPVINVAVEKGRKDMVELLISYGASVNRISKGRYSTLTIATQNNDRSMIEYLIREGADPNEGEAGGNGWPLGNAIAYGDFRLVDFLLDNGAELMNFDGDAFRQATRGGERMLLELLKRVPTEHRERALDAALQRAASSVRLSLCELLLGMGANPNFVGGEHGSPLHAVVLGTWRPSRHHATDHRQNIFELLVKKGAKPRDIEGYPCILVSALGSPLWSEYETTGSNTNFAMELLKAGANPNGKALETYRYHNPLQAAVAFAHSMIEPLILAGADVNAFSGEFGTALHVAAYFCDTRVITILLQHGAKLDFMSSKHGSVIQVAAGSKSSRQSSVRTIQLLHSRGASIDVVDERGEGPLHTAARCNNLEAVKWLLEHGADPNAEGERGTPAQVAILNERWRVASYLEQRYGRTPDRKRVASGS
ncbi:hypothetical protein TWF481_004403 [Arthrobotrys musiformis]|uniref:Ankyrin n=1 Tax=Arthrobotrys musiformis TaxID=47236 RepID=A0AAV9WLJ8_9PEZI